MIHWPSSFWSCSKSVFTFGADEYRCRNGKVFWLDGLPRQAMTAINASICHPDLLDTRARFCTRYSKGRKQKAEGRRQKAEGRRQKAEGRRQKAEGRRQKAEGRRQKAEGRRQKDPHSLLPSDLCL